MRNDELINEDETHLLFKENKVLIKNISNGIMRSLIVWNLSKKSLHGSNLMKKIDEFFKPQIEAGLIKNVSHSKVYPILNQMEEEGLLKSHEGMHNNHQVKFYNLTSKGSRVFETVKHDFQKNFKRDIVQDYIFTCLK